MRRRLTACDAEVRYLDKKSHPFGRGWLFYCGVWKNSLGNFFLRGLSGGCRGRSVLFRRIYNGLDYVDDICNRLKWFAAWAVETNPGAAAGYLC